MFVKVTRLRSNPGDYPWGLTVTKPDKVSGRARGPRPVTGYAFRYAFHSPSDQDEAVIELLRRNRDFRMLWMASVVSLGGDWFATVALIGRITDLGKGTWITPAVAAALVFVCLMLPSFLVTPIAGPLADRFDRKQIMIAASVLQAVAALLFLLPTRSTIWLAFVAQALVATLAGFFSPASQASLANLVSKEELPKAGSLLGTTWGAMLALGSWAGAWFSTQFGRNAAFIANAASFLLAAFIITRIKGRTRAEGTVRQRMRPIADTAAALRFARTNRPLFYLLFSKGGFGLASGIVGLLTSLASTRFNGGDGTLGLLLGGRGVGVVLGPIIAGRLGASNEVSGILRACGLSCMVYGSMYFLVGHAPYLWLAFVLTALAHLGGGTQWTLSTYGLNANTPDEFRGRIGSADFALVSLSMSISFVAGAFLDRRFGTTAAFTTLSIVSIAWGMLYLKATNTIRSGV
jgi:MFS family permease